MIRNRLSTSKKYDCVNVFVNNDIKYELFKKVKSILFNFSLGCSN